MNGDLEGDAAVLLEPDLVSAATRAVRDDRVAAAVSRDDVQVVRLPVALNKPVVMNEAETVLKKDLMQLFSWMCSIPLAMAALSVEVKAASMVYGTTPLGQWYLITTNIKPDRMKMPLLSKSNHKSISGSIQILTLAWRARSSGWLSWPPLSGLPSAPAPRSSPR